LLYTEYDAGRKKKSLPKPQGANRKNALREMLNVVIKRGFLPQHIEKLPLRRIHSSAFSCSAHII
jgi:hypothetical protein